MKANAEHRDCIAKANALLREHNTMLALAVSITNPEHELIHIRTIKLDPTRPGRPRALFATYCPMCGEKL